MGLLLAWTALGAWAVAGDEPSSAPAARATPRDADAALRRALDLERQRNWAGAIEVYEEALEHWPSRTEFRHRLRLCEIHYKLGRRYQDQSFRNVLLRLPRAQALALYDELLDRIQSHYVEPVAMEPMLRRGFDNLEVALRDPAFLAVHSPQAPADRVRWLRDAYRQLRDRVEAHTSDEAKTQVMAACDLGYQALHLGAAAVILEFVYGACDALDDYTCYLTPDKLEDLYAMIDGNFVGLGIELKLDPQGLRLVGVIRGGPAWDAGLKVGDRITHVDGHSIRGLGLDEAASKLQGTEGSAVAITVLHRDGKAQSYRLLRRHVEVESVAKAEMIDPALHVGYIQLTGFQKTSTEELDQAILALQRQGMRYLILDLRGNPGGLLNVAVEMADRFLDQGVIVTTRGRAPGQSSTYRSRPGATWRMPLAILIDHDSASASEILAGALKDNRRAVVLGERSYGKGSVQSIFALRSAPAGLKLTTAKFYSPLNRPYSEQGVDPDVLVRAAAKPGPNDSEPTFEPGDPEHDPVLVQALAQARRQLMAVK
jgi:carboxyl-terminal processing protease